jgi:hypothetical protein
MREKFKKLSKIELIEKINQKDTEWFSDLYVEYGWTRNQPDDINKFKKVWELNWGDGNDHYIALDFYEENLVILLEGTYSSYDSSNFDSVSIAVPFEFKETRYRKAELADIREMKIDEILNG